MTRITGQFRYTKKDPERVYKLSSVKVCAPKTQPYKSWIKTEITCLTVYTITPMFDNYEVNIFKALAMIYHRFHVET